MARSCASPVVDGTSLCPATQCGMLPGVSKNKVICSLCLQVCIYGCETENSGFSSKSSIFNRVFHHKPSIMGYRHIYPVGEHLPPGKVHKNFGIHFL